MTLYVLVSTLTPITAIEEPNFGVAVTGVKDNSLAKEIGISNGATIQKIAGVEIHAVGDLNTALHSNLGKTIGIAWLDEEGAYDVRNNNYSFQRYCWYAYIGRDN